MTAPKQPTSSVLDLAGGRLWALTHPYRLDGRVTTYPAAVDGYASMNSYVLLEGERALLVDSGWTVEEERLLGQLDVLLAGVSSLSMLPMRYGEFGGLCNCRPIAGRFPVDRIYGRIFGEPKEWLDFRPDLDDPSGPVGGALARVPAAALRSTERIAIDSRGRRNLQLLPAPLRLLTMPWAFDEGTGTLFSGDVFGWVSRERPEGPWEVFDDDDPTTAADVERFLLDNRYWWLAGARTERLLSDIAAVFESHDVETIAPGTGAILRGRRTVERHLTLLQEVVAAAAYKPSVGLAMGGWSRPRAA
jgi:glyoxylase-like metal-dependent hydrolase (beta-lactamase superfamily II)